MKYLLFSFALCAASAARAAAPVVPETLNVRAVAWDQSFKPASDKEFLARVVSEVGAARDAGADVIVFPEGFAGSRALEDHLGAIKDAAGPDHFVVLGYSVHHELGWDYETRRAYVLSGGAWQTQDKLDPTPAERAAQPPVKPGIRLVLYRFRGGVVSVLSAYSFEKPEVAASLKRRAPQLVLVPAPADDAAGTERLARAAAWRAAELGAAVVTAPPAPASATLRLPAQRGFDLAPAASAGRDFKLPWRKLLDLRRPDSGNEARPFLDPSSGYQIEI